MKRIGLTQSNVVYLVFEEYCLAQVMLPGFCGLAGTAGRCGWIEMGLKLSSSDVVQWRLVGFRSSKCSFLECH